MTMRYAHIIEDDLLEEIEAMTGMVNVNFLPTHTQNADLLTSTKSHKNYV
jgi:hypothetical protein